MVLIVASLSLASLGIGNAQTSTVQSELSETNAALQAAFTAVLDIANAGADVTELTAQLNTAAQLLANAQNAQPPVNKTQQATEIATVRQIATHVQQQATALTQQAQTVAENKFYVNMAFLAVGTALFATTLLLSKGLPLLQRKRKSTSVPPKSRRAVLLAVGLVGLLIFASPTLGQLLPVPAGQPFSAIYTLDTNQKLLTPPSTIQSNTTYSTYLCIENHEGDLAYYSCLVKLRSDTDPEPSLTSTTPSSLPTLFQYNVLLGDNQTWQGLFRFQLNVNSENPATVNTITINGQEISVDKTTVWSPQENGYYFGMLIELWKFDPTTGILQFDGRFVHFYLNVTATA